MWAGVHQRHAPKRVLRRSSGAESHGVNVCSVITAREANFAGCDVLFLMDRTQSIDTRATLAQYGYFPQSLPPCSSKPVVFRCEFCLDDFVSSFKSIGRTDSTTCRKCRSIAAAYTLFGSNGNRHGFYSRKRKILPDTIDDGATLEKYGYSASNLGSGSTKKVVAVCEFCRNKFDTSLCIINKHPATACKKCDAVASHYSRLGSIGDKHEFWGSRQPKLDFKDVDIQATVVKYGYSPRDVNPFTTKRIIAICAYCSDHVEIRMAKYSQKAGNIACPKCVRKKTVRTLQQKYGVMATLDIPSVQLKLTNPKTEQIIESVLTSTYKVGFKRNFVIGPYSFDFFIPSCNLLIECQGDYFHDFKKNGYSGTPQDRAKSSYIENNTGHKLVWLWEHELHIGRIRKVLDFHIGKILEPSISPELHSLSFKKILNSEAHSFLAQFHYLGNLGTVATCFGAYDVDVLVAVCAFGGVTRQQSIQKVNKHIGANFGPKELKELRRFCIRPNVGTKNMASFCLKKFLQLCKDASPDARAVLSFSDPTVGDVGTIYKASNWKQLPDAVKSYYYMDPQTGKRIHKKTVWDTARQAHMSEIRFASDAGLEKVDEMPKHVWLRVM